MTQKARVSLCSTGGRIFLSPKHYGLWEKADERWLAALGVAASHKRKANRSVAGDFGIIPISW